METNKRNYKLYVHINKIDGKRYYGITREKNPNRRWKNGKGYPNNEYFTNAIEKHGWDNFEHIILFENLTESEAKKLEIEHIAKYKTKNREFGYNLTDGGEGANGLKRTEEWKQNHSKAMSGENNPFYNKHHTEETKQKISEAKKGKNNPMYGKNFTEEHKQKLSGKNNHKAKSVICLTTKRIFFTAADAARCYDIANSNISNCCKGKRKSAGTYNGQKLVWKYLNHKHNFTYRIKRTMES